MGRDNHPRARQAAKLKRQHKGIKSAERILIVSEGSKTEPNYINEIRQTLRLPTANIMVLPSEYGTCPLHVVNFAKDVFLNGNPHSRIPPKSFEKIYTIFDRDEHDHFYEAIDLANSFNKTLRNDQRVFIEFKPIVSIPNFELWLLLHFENCTVYMNRHQVIDKLKNHIHDYQKGNKGYFNLTRDNLEIASSRSKQIFKQNLARDENQLYSNIHLLIEDLFNQKKK